MRLAAAIRKPNGSIPIQKAWMPKKVSNSSDHQPEEQATQKLLINERSDNFSHLLKLFLQADNVTSLQL